MKLMLIPLFIFQGLICNGQPELMALFKKMSFSENELYFFCRGTKSKAGIIANSFNLVDSNMTHVGIGFIQNGNAAVYHVADVIGQKTALKIDSIESFVKPEDIYYFSIWSYTITTQERSRIKEIFKEYNDKQIVFDFSFLIKNDDTLYCSEFCVRVLSQANIENLKFNAEISVSERNIAATILRRKTFIYYPVDFFQQNKKIKKVLEYRFF